jgi:hypothetical protein
MDSEDFDANGMHNTGSNTSRITVASSGSYWMFGRTTAVATTTGSGQIAIQLKKNGASGSFLDNDIHDGAAYVSGTAFSLHVGGVYVLAANDYVELYGLASGSTTFGLVSYENATRLQVAFLG